jgi:2-hydroxycyclohexanecarboxyl-CoA dehydrogenase
MSVETNGAGFGRLSGVALVTGAARGIGQAIATTLAERGATVAMIDIRVDDVTQNAKELMDRGLAAHAFEMDVTDTTSVRSTVAEIESALGPVEILVNNVGWDRLYKFLDTDEDFWQKVIDINYTGVLRTIHTILPGMIERQGGRIINIGSDAGRVGSSMEAVYAGTKGAVIAFTKTIAREAGRYGVTANVVCPGATNTPLHHEIVGEGGNAEKTIGAIKRIIPLKRIGEPEDIAGAVAYLASPEAAFVTGQTLSVSGGLTMA